MKGIFFCGFAAAGPQGFDVLRREIVATGEGLLMIGFLGFNRFILATASQEAVSLLNGRMDWWSNIDNVMEDIRRLVVDMFMMDVLYQT
ncbi:unnamed protein product [Prunus armeniaca]|uniref:Uncharacterized protein n=1 Tax=Prunus armeniaca TaxID=36596 RepID=A0A6J5Y6C3_PRUAR|nr:unnamed protein product [Prunus armeniaca]